MNDDERSALVEMIHRMKGHITQERWQRIQSVSSERTTYVTVVLENIYYTQNLSAIVRSCDCMGIQEIHLLEGSEKIRLNSGVSLGAGKWVDLVQSGSGQTVETLKALKSRGYRIVATVPGLNSQPLENLDVRRGKIALLFGQETDGLSAEVLSMADEAVTIPMCGFSGSLNISVSTAICLYELRRKLVSSGVDWALGDEELLRLQYRWIKNSIKHSERLERVIEVEMEHPNSQ